MRRGEWGTAAIHVHLSARRAEGRAAGLTGGARREQNRREEN